VKSTDFAAVRDIPRWGMRAWQNTSWTAGHKHWLGRWACYSGLTRRRDLA